jgi:hypothetical protein
MFRRSRHLFTGIVVLFALYLVIGFFLAPVAIRTWVLPSVQARLHPTLSVKHLAFNPLALSLTAREVILREGEASPLLTLDELHLNLSSRSLWRLRPVVSELRLEALEAEALIAPDGRLNWSRLLAPTAEPEAEPEEEAGPFHFVLERFVLREARLRFADASLADPFEQKIGPLDLELQDLDTSLAETGNFAFRAVTPEGAELVWEGELQLYPLRGTGTVRFSGVALHRASPYLAAHAGLDSPSASLSWEFHYTAFPEDPEPVLRLHEGSFHLQALQLHRAGEEAAFFELGALELGGIEVDLLAREASVGQLEIEGPRLRAHRAADGAIDFLAPFPPMAERPAEAPEVDAPTGPGATPWQWKLAGVTLRDGRLDWSDDALATPASLAIELPELTLGSLSADLAQPAPLELRLVLVDGGNLHLRGEIAPAPLAASLELVLEAFDPGRLGPYWSPRAGLSWEAGTISARTTLSLASSAEGASVFETRGDLMIEAPRLLAQGEESPFLEGGTLRAQGIHFDSRENRLAIDALSLAEMAVTLRRHADGGLNLPGGDGAEAENEEDDPAPTAESPPHEPPEASLHLQLARLELDATSVRFQDEAIDPAVVLRLDDFGGTIEGIDSDPASRASLSLAGRIQQVAPLTLEGSVHPFPDALFLDLTLKLSGTDLTLASPYAARHLGRRIAKGKLDLEIVNRIEERQLSGHNTLRLDQLEFGERVPSPEALNLPLDLALTLFKDSRGVIEFRRLGIAGDLDDPSFSYSGVFLQVFGNLLTKALTSPFSFLAGAFAPAGVDPGEIAFAPASAALGEEDDPAIEALVAIHQARPLVAFEVRGHYAPADENALRERRLDELLAARRPSASAAAGRPADLRESLLRELARERGLVPATPDASPPTAPTLEELEDRILASLTIPQVELLDLARHRGQAVQAALVAAGLPTGSLFLLEPSPAPALEPSVKVNLGR